MQNFKRIISTLVRKIKIGTRLWLFQILVIAVISFSSILFIYQSITQISNQYVYQYLQSEQKIVADNLSMCLEEVALLSLRYKNTMDFYSIVTNPELTYNQKETALQKTASSIKALASDSVASAYLVDDKYHVYLLNGDSQIPYPDVKLVKYSSDDPYFHIGSVCNDSNGNYYIPISVRFNNFSTTQEIGSLIFYLSQESLANFLDEQLHGSFITFLTDSNGIILSHNDFSYIGKSTDALDIHFSDNLNQKAKINGQDYFVSISPLSNASNRIGFTWQLITAISCEILYDTLRQLLHLLILLIILIIPIAFCLSFLLSSRLTNSLRRLSAKLRNLNEQTLNSFLEQTPRDELWDLEQGYNEMIIKINQLIQKNKEEQIQKRELEFTALQAQINPHFLYNTLDTIGWIAALKDQPEIEQLVLELSRFFRLSLHKGDVYVPLEDELGIVSSYVKIEQLRNPNKFDITYDIHPDLLQIMIPKLILQPVVENAVKHGVTQIQHHGLITVRGYHIADDVYLEVVDNGPGIQNKKTKLHGSGYGLKNINERIQLEYGSEYGLNIISREQEGTTVCLHIHF